MAGNQSLRAANKAKQDEFYTQMDDISNELKHYRDHFRGKVVFCNCDDPYESNFFKYFALNSLGLKKRIATCYCGSPMVGNELLFEVDGEGVPLRKKAYKVEITEVDDYNNDGAVDLSDVKYLIQNDNNVLILLHGDALYGAGDFRSAECVELLKEADIVCTNPPFSLFREYVEQLMEFSKKFLIIGNQNALTYRDIFTHIMNDEMWLGYKFGDMSFKVPPYFEPRATRYWQDEDGQKWRSMGNICWFTNLDISKRHDVLDLWKHYNDTAYSKYDYYNAINVDKVTDIPVDFKGLMGVPITFLDKYNPDQFDIVDGIGRYSMVSGPTPETQGKYLTNINGKPKYARIIIRKKQ